MVASDVTTVPGTPVIATLPTWMRGALWATGVMNVAGAIGFLPPMHAVRALAGFPEGEHPLYLMTVSMFVLLFGIGYLALAATNRPDRFFVTLAAVGKLSFVAVVTALWLGGSLPLRAVGAASGDLVFAVLFFVWLYG